jgi:hypothetical protein
MKPDQKHWRDLYEFDTPVVSLLSSPGEVRAENG